MHVHLFRLKTKSRHWYAQIYIGGKRHRFCCKTADKPTARDYARNRAQELQGRFNRGLVGCPPRSLCGSRKLSTASSASFSHGFGCRPKREPPRCLPRRGHTSRPTPTWRRSHRKTEALDPRQHQPDRVRAGGSSLTHCPPNPAQLTRRKRIMPTSSSARPPGLYSKPFAITGWTPDLRGIFAWQALGGQTPGYGYCRPTTRFSSQSIGENTMHTRCVRLPERIAGIAMTSHPPSPRPPCRTNEIPM